MVARYWELRQFRFKRLIDQRFVRSQAAIALTRNHPSGPARISILKITSRPTTASGTAAAMVEEAGNGAYSSPTTVRRCLFISRMNRRCWNIPASNSPTPNDTSVRPRLRGDFARISALVASFSFEVLEKLKNGEAKANQRECSADSGHESSVCTHAGPLE
jgi:hypothetical protein